MSDPQSISEVLSANPIIQARAKMESTDYKEREAARLRNERISQLARDTGPRLDPLQACTLKMYEVYHNDQKPIVATIHRYIENIEENVRSGAGLLVIGRRGTGKDHLCIAAAREAIRTCDKSVRWVDGRELFRHALDDVRGEGGGYQISAYMGAGVLILSDPIQPGVALRDYQQDVLWRIVNTRYQHCRPTFVTSNCKDLKEFEQGIGTAMLSRLRHNATMVLCNWPDYRERK